MPARLPSCLKEQLNLLSVVALWEQTLTHATCYCLFFHLPIEQGWLFAAACSLFLSQRRSSANCRATRFPSVEIYLISLPIINNPVKQIPVSSAWVEILPPHFLCHFSILLLSRPHRNLPGPRRQYSIALLLTLERQSFASVCKLIFSTRCANLRLAKGRSEQRLCKPSEFLLPQAFELRQPL